MSWVAGVDGCRAGWLAVLLHVDDLESPRCRVARHLCEIMDGPEAPRIVALDMPIGLPDRIAGPGRVAEQAVRGFLGDRQSSVFSIPARGAVYAETYASCCRLALATSEPARKVSKQAFMLFPKIREVDAMLRARPDLAARIFEVHPEVAFWSMNGERPLPEPKKCKGRPYEPGLRLRRELLTAAGLPRALIEHAAPAGADADDYVDALACLVVARHIALGQGRPFPDPPGRDTHGLPIAIWTFRSERAV